MAVALSLVSLTAACARNEPTATARGEYYAAGQPDYDEFFVRVYRNQRGTGEAIELEKEARRALAKALGMREDSPTASLAPKLRERSQALGSAGVSVSLILRDDPAAPSVELGIQGEPDSAQRAWLEAVRSAADQTAQLAAQTTADVEEVDALRVRATELDRQVDTAFRKEGQSKWSEVRENLRDAQKLLVIVSDKRKQLVKSSAELVSAFRGAFGSAAAAPAPAAVASDDDPSKAKKKKKRPPRMRARPARAKPAAAPAQAAAPKPAPAPAPAPAPKPAPAKADFEP